MVLGGDGSILRGAELARPRRYAAARGEPRSRRVPGRGRGDDLERIVQVVVDRSYTVEERMTLDVEVRLDGELIFDTWALNEASVEKAARERMLEVLVEVDGRPLSRWGCDGVVVATPTGSTAYAFSAGGPIVWPEVEAILMVPLSAHALFSRPIVVAPTSRLSIELIAVRTGAVCCGVTAAGWSRCRRAPDRGAARRHPGPAGPGARGAVHRPAGGEVRSAGARLAGRRRSANATATSQQEKTLTPCSSEIRITGSGRHRGRHAGRSTGASPRSPARPGPARRWS